MKESQTTEFKAGWCDEYLRHLCAFANTQGSSLFIGVGDDDKVVRTKESKKLLEDIPNKAINYLGIIVDVHLMEKDGKEYLEIEIPQSSVPVAYKVFYYIKSGSTKQELKGAELQHFILKKMRRTFDELPAEGTKLSNIDEKVVRKLLRKVIKASPLSPEAGTDELQNIITNLKLTTESGKIT